MVATSDLRSVQDRRSKRSKASSLSLEDESVRRAVLASLTEAQIAQLPFDWKFWGREDQQLPPGDDWFVWLIMAGRGWGKNRTAVENIAMMVNGPSPLICPSSRTRPPT